ncbi:MAG: GNAT family N-acetyltransferase [Acidimicrobiales bacterium]
MGHGPLVGSPPHRRGGDTALHHPADVDGLTVMAQDPETVKWTTVPQRYGPAEAEGWLRLVEGAWRKQTMWSWSIELADGDRPRFAGNLDIRLGPPPDVGFALAPWARGRGVMVRAARLALRWAFDEGELPVVHWSAGAGNLASWRVAHAVGFTFDGSRPRSIPHRGELRDGWFAHLGPEDVMTPRTRWRLPVELVGERVRLRPHRNADLPRIAEACSDARTRHWLPTMPAPYTEEHARSFVLGCRLEESLGISITWAAADRESGRLLANVGLLHLASDRSPGSGEIGYWAHPDARGWGVVREAVDLVVVHALAPEGEDGLGLRRLQIGAAWATLPVVVRPREPASSRSVTSGSTAASAMAPTRTAPGTTASIRQGDALPGRLLRERHGE